MACGCQQDCNCVIKDGTTTTVTGSGSAADPYKIEVTPGNSSITVDDTPCIDLSGNGSPGLPLMADLVISPDVDNLLTKPGSGCTDNGLKIACSDISSCLVVGDCLEIVDGAINTKIAPDVDGGNGIECTPDGLLVAPSADGGNTMVYGSDGNLYVPPGNCVATPMEVEIDVAGGSACLSATGGGCEGDPYIVTLGLAADPNALDCTATGLQVIPSTDAGNTLVFGSDGRLYTTGGSTSLQVVDTPTVDHTLTGTGTPGDPFILTSCSPTILPSDTTCIAMQVLGGSGCADPYVVMAEPILSPDACNGLECRGNGLFTDRVPSGQVIVGNEGCTAGGGVPTPANGLFPIPNTEYCATITNPDPCRSMHVMVFVEINSLRIKADAGTEEAEVQARFVTGTNLAGLGVGTWSFNVHRNVGPGGVDERRPGGSHMRDAGVLLPPGGSGTVCVDLASNNINGINVEVEACVILRLVGTYA